jgi:hypothetical protein
MHNAYYQQNRSYFNYLKKKKITHIYTYINITIYCSFEQRKLETAVVTIVKMKYVNQYSVFINIKYTMNKPLF